MHKQKYSIKDIDGFLGEYVLEGKADFFFTNIKDILNAGTDSLVWINPNRKDRNLLLEKTKANVVVCDIKEHYPDNPNKTYIKVSNPKQTIICIVDKLFRVDDVYEIHPTAIIHPEAAIHPETHIGPNSHIGKCQINQGTIIRGNCYVHDNTVIGKNVLVHHGAVIGSDGFGFSRTKEGYFTKFPHIGGVIVEDNVEIGANTCIDRGTFGNTIIGEGTKIDNLVHIAHNVVIGKHAAIIANAMIAGSTEIGDFAWISPSASVKDVVRIGKNATIGLGASVLRSVSDNQVWIGNPAEPIEQFMEKCLYIKNQITKRQNE
jgi:UDP-3-O-[3-hydroxymyristoyl] glucosamine N-acyltransferase